MKQVGNSARILPIHNIPDYLEVYLLKYQNLIVVSVVSVLYNVVHKFQDTLAHLLRSGRAKLTTGLKMSIIYYIHPPIKLFPDGHRKGFRKDFWSH